MLNIRIVVFSELQFFLKPFFIRRKILIGKNIIKLGINAHPKNFDEFSIPFFNRRVKTLSELLGFTNSSIG